jgi:hypothetical protein
MCPQSCSLAVAVVLLPVYTAVAWLWVCMSRYCSHSTWVVSVIIICCGWYQFLSAMGQISCLFFTCSRAYFVCAWPPIWQLVFPMLQGQLEGCSLFSKPLYVPRIGSINSMICFQMVHYYMSVCQINRKQRRQQWTIYHLHYWNEEHMKK